MKQIMLSRRVKAIALFSIILCAASACKDGEKSSATSALTSSTTQTVAATNKVEALKTVDGGVIAMCRETGKSLEVCECSVSALRKELSDDEFITYEKISAAYLKKKSNGQPMGDAWDGSIWTVAAAEGKDAIALLDWSNDVGKTFRKYMKNCAS